MGKHSLLPFTHNHPIYLSDDGEHIYGNEKTDFGADKIVASYVSPDDAEFIVHACNCHDELVEACKLALVIIRDMSGEAEDIVKEKLIQALAKAEGK